MRLHQNTQRLLRPLAVLNPYADRLTFLSDKTRTRRDHEKYLTLIDVIALLHQHQRRVLTMRDGDELVEYVEATVADIAQANALAHQVLGRSLDELPPQTRRLLAAIVEDVRAQMRERQVRQADMRFTRREVRAVTGWGDTQLKLHLARLVDLEYLLAHRAARGGGFGYEFLYDGDSTDAPHLSGLIDVQSLGYDGARSGVESEWSAPGRGVVGPWSGGSRGDEIAADPALARPAEESSADNAENARLAAQRQSRVVPASSFRGLRGFVWVNVTL